MEALLLAVKYISIHAPRTGSDRQRKIRDFISPRFQSTLPARGATERTMALANCQTDFNPRSPHGERLIFLHLRTVNNYFNPRSPHGERPDRANSRARPGENFNPRSPHGERHERGGGMAKRPPFQSTLPARGATIVASKADCTIRISIHAPRTGSDAAWRMQSGSLLIFQSTLPARGATNRF